MASETDILLGEDGDIKFVDGDMVQAVSIPQHCKIRLQFVRGEWFKNLNLGVPYFEEVFIKDPRLEHLKALFRDVIINTPGIVSLQSLDVSLVAKTRVLTINFRASTVTGQIDEEVTTTV